ncbi:hypothetical protein H4R26_000064 [Coemansia thaxteri]|uniref:Amino acid transporter transmembrane domain-containing protein n=1 Tax=Coemansia thaxteri TaxID=2663907 RepID=A0A9W8BKQ4_9FUNG|nr:hypothetical protein H4R26_000064 [Coemansia thaxteri]KAJ2488160.1 hypothetical protein EV174_000128 [Coemansia sp. RSA 2320]
MEQAAASGRDTVRYLSDSDRRLPSNAQRAATPAAGSSEDASQRTTPAPQSIRKGSASIARATDRLALAPASFPRSSYMEQHAALRSSGSPDPSHASPRRLPSEALDNAVAARRLKRHLVTRGAGGSDAGSSHHAPADEEDGYAGDVNDDDDEAQVPVDPLTLPSGDVTYSLYHWHRTHELPSSAEGGSGRRRGSFSGVPSDSEWAVPYSQRQITVPGGFRRQFMHDRAAREGRAPVALLTDNFVDFIGLYGHFAGGDYPSDEDDYEEDGEDAPLLRREPTQRNIHATASNKKAFFLLLKAFVGTGVLVLPKAFSNGGLLASALTMLAVAWYAWHCMIILGEVYLRVGGSYGDLGAKLFGNWARQLITVSILLAQIGFCSAYTIFVATNMRDLWNSLTGCRHNYSSTFWVLAQLLAYIPLAWVRRIKQFAPFALAANVFIMAGLGYVLAYDVASISSRGVADIVQYNPLRFPLLVGTAVFAFEGVTLVIPVIDSMAHQEKFSAVLTTALSVCIVVFSAIGALSYLAFGDGVETVILLNLPGGAPTIAVQLLYSLAIMLSVPLQLFPAVRILESGIFPHSGKANARVKWQKNAFRALMVLVIALIAIFGADQLDNFIAIIGAFSCTPLSFIFPAALHYQINPGKRWTRIKDVALGAVGCVILVYVTYIGIISWGSARPSIDKCASP